MKEILPKYNFFRLELTNLQTAQFYNKNSPAEIRVEFSISLTKNKKIKNLLRNNQFFRFGTEKPAKYAGLLQ